MIHKTYFALLFIYLLNYTNGAKLKHLKATQLGLYGPADKVVILTSKNFADQVLQQNRSSLVEFYNSYCGHCKRFAPTYNKMAARLSAWQQTIIIGAIDCAVEENNDICREYEIMAYPTMRYFSANFTPAEKHYGLDVETQNPKEIRQKVSRWLAAEYSFLKPIEQAEATEILENTNEPDLTSVIIYDYANATTGVQTALHLRQYEKLQVLHTESKEVASVFGLDTAQCILVTTSVNKTSISCVELNNDDPFSYVQAINKTLNSLNFQFQSNIPLEKLYASTAYVTTDNSENSEIIALVKKEMHTVYQADLEQAVHYMLFNEIPRARNISGERLLALKSMLDVLDRYRPVSYHGLVKHMQLYVSQFNQQVSGQDFYEELQRLQKELGTPTLIANSFIGCLGTTPNYRGFTCSLWQLFHHLTVKAAFDAEAQQHPDAVLKAIYGYVKYYFGCSDCSQHFQQMAARRDIWGVKTTDAAVLWLWAAHNEVNERLKGDGTEDPNFPKILFPSETSCAKCYMNDIATNTKVFNNTAVLDFLMTIHSHANISSYGLETSGEGIYSNSSSGERMRQRRMAMNAFSDFDMRFGILLYGFCICMIIVAFKLFVFKKSRRVKSLSDLSSRAA